jgi:hypothetical protein
MEKESKQSEGSFEVKIELKLSPTFSLPVFRIK